MKKYLQENREQIRNAVLVFMVIVIIYFFFESFVHGGIHEACVDEYEERVDNLSEAIRLAERELEKGNVRNARYFLDGAGDYNQKPPSCP